MCVVIPGLQEDDRTRETPSGMLCVFWGNAFEVVQYWVARRWRKKVSAELAALFIEAPARVVISCTRPLQQKAKPCSYLQIPDKITKSTVLIWEVVPNQ